MTLWVFGDSFTKHFDQQPDTWVERTRQLLDTDIQSFAKPMAPIEYSFNRFNDIRNKIKENDIILFGISNINWMWFDKNISFVYPIYNEKAIKNYYSYLTNLIEMHKTYLINFLYNLHTLTKKLNLHTIIIENFTHYENMNLSNIFPNFHFAKGVFSVASDYEWKPEFVNIAAFEAKIEWDGRVNHFTRSNHIRIADIIVDNIKNKTPIDFSNLLQGFLYKELFEDKDFQEYELFGKRIEP